ncbi:MAG: tetratricopeptide repeat protein [Burkholderiales bacterium]
MTLTIEQVLRSAVEHQNAGRLAEAEQACREILRVAPAHPAARHLLGVIAHQVGKHELALELIDRALEVQPDYAEALSNRGLVLNVLGRHAEALDSCERALALRPDYVEALINCGIALHDLRRHEKALATYSRALELRPGFAVAHSNRAATLRELKRYDEALASCERALALRPDYAEAMSNRGVVLYGLDRDEEALASYNGALQLDPGHAPTLSNRSLVLKRLGRHDEALADCDRALAIRPRFAEALNNRGMVLRALKRHAEALESFEQALALSPDYAEALSNRGLALVDQQRNKEAIGSFDRAIALNPDYADAWSNRGLVLYNLGRHEEALASYERALTIEPASPAATLNQSICILLSGDLERGFEKYESRWQCESHAAAARAFDRPTWLGGEPLAGKSVLLHGEQGLGDILMFLRYVPMTAALGAKVFLEVPGVLLPLVRGLAGPQGIYAEGETLPATDFRASLLSLARAFRTTAGSIPAQVPYLSAARGAGAAWRRKFAPDTRLLVGLSWRGNPGYERDRDRSIPFATIAPLLSAPGIQFISLQNELLEAERALTADLTNFVHAGEDFARTAEIVSAVDLVITVDSAWSHWAGAIGKPVWVLLAATPHWAWMLGREDSPWYPSARLYRRAIDGAWDAVVIRALRDLTAYASRSTRRRRR